MKRFLVIALFFCASLSAFGADSLIETQRKAEQGDAAAQYNLGAMYRNGDGVPKDLVQAHAWWNIAGSQGFKEAKKNLVSLEKEMTADQKAEAMKIARELFEKIPKK